MEAVIEKLNSHLKSKKFLPVNQKRYQFENVTLILLKCKQGNPRLLGFSHCCGDRFGVLPIFMTDQGIICPFPCKIKFTRGHAYNSPAKYYQETIPRYLKRFYKSNPKAIVRDLSKEIITVDQPTVNMIPFFSENFGHEVCQLLSLYEYLVTAHVPDTHPQPATIQPSYQDVFKTATQIMHYQTYPHLHQMNDLVIKHFHKESLSLNRPGEVFLFKKLIFIPTRMRAFPDVSLKPAIDLILSKIPTTKLKNDKIGILKSTDNRYFAHSGKYSKKRAPSGAFPKKMSEFLSQHNGYQMIQHESMDLIGILTHLKNAKKIILSWGAIAYWGQFLKNHQKCFVLWHKHYTGERKAFKNRICFDDRLFNKYYITRPTDGKNYQEISDWIKIRENPESLIAQPETKPVDTKNQLTQQLKDIPRI